MKFLQGQVADGPTPFIGEDSKSLRNLRSRAPNLLPSGGLLLLDHAFFFPDRSLDALPEVVLRLLYREELAGGFSNGFQVSQQLQTRVALLQMGMVVEIYTCANKVGKLALELLAAHDI